MSDEVKLIEKVREVIREKQYSHHTEKAYIDWIYRFLVYHDGKAPEKLNEKGIVEFLAFLDEYRNDAAATQHQALNAVVFLFKEVLNQPLEHIHYKQAKLENKLPLVFSRREVHEVLACLKGEIKLMASLLYGCGLRLHECVNLRVKDLDFDLNEIWICSKDGDRIRYTIMPQLLIAHLRRQVTKVRIRFEENHTEKLFKGGSIPELQRQIHPDAPMRLEWQYLFPSPKLKMDVKSEGFLQSHRDESCLQKAVREAVLSIGLTKKASCTTFRHSFATHLLEDGYDIRTVQKLLGHKNVRSTLIYTRVLDEVKLNVRSPLD